jgi:hypothetical protein
MVSLLNYTKRTKRNEYANRERKKSRLSERKDQRS